MGVLDWLFPIADTIGGTFVQLFVGPWEEFYVAGFNDSSLQPVVDLYGRRPLEPTWSGTLNVDEYRPARTVKMIPPQPGLPLGAARLSLYRPTNPSTGELVAGTLLVGLGVPFPPEVERFMISALFAFPEGPHGEDDQWATVLNARRGNVEVGSNPVVPEADTNLTRIAVTLQANYKVDESGMPLAPGARTNRPGGAFLGTSQTPPYPNLSAVGPWLPQYAYNPLFGPPPAIEGFGTSEFERGLFRLTLIVERPSGIASSSLRVWGYQVDYPPPPHPSPGYSETRAFLHPFIDLTSRIGVAGVNLVLTEGNGPIAVTLRELRMYRPKVGILYPIDGILGFLSRATKLMGGPSSLQMGLVRLRASLMERAFKDPPRN